MKTDDIFVDFCLVAWYLWLSLFVVCWPIEQRDDLSLILDHFFDYLLIHFS